MREKNTVIRGPKVLPVHIRMAIEIAASICRRIAAKRLDMPQEHALIKVVPTSCGVNNENR